MLDKIKYLILFLLVSLVILSCKRRHGDERRIVVNPNVEVESKRNNIPTKNTEIRNQTPTITTTSQKNLSEHFELLEKSVFMVFSVFENDNYSQGSGFFISPNIGITNYHVIEDAEQVFINIGNDVYEVTEILKYSPTNQLDYVIFKTNYRNKTYLKIADKSSRVGEEVFAIGSPKGLKNSLTKGTISGFREIQRIQIDATIDHGSSGGPLFNLDGEVIGVTSSGMGTGSELNFAIDIKAIPVKNYIKRN